MYMTLNVCSKIHIRTVVVFFLLGDYVLIRMDLIYLHNPHFHKPWKGSFGTVATGRILQTGNMSGKY